MDIIVEGIVNPISSGWYVDAGGSLWHWDKDNEQAVRISNEDGVEVHYEVLCEYGPFSPVHLLSVKVKAAQ